MYLTIRRCESTDPLSPEEIPAARDAIVAATAQTTVPV
jgi:hypothetical protein